jgi:preprotein translocase subunit SecA
MVIDKLADEDSKEGLRAAVLKEAERAVTLENEHIQQGANTLFNHFEQSLKNQMAEKEEILDAYLDTLDPSEAHDYQQEIGSIIGNSIRLGTRETQMLEDDPQSMKAPFKDALRASIMLGIVRRLLLTLERRVGEKWQLKPSDLAVLPWGEMKEQINEQIYNSQTRRMERLFGDGREVERDLDANQELLEEALEDDDALLALLQLTTQGVRIGFDEKSHRRQLRAHQRLNYLFSMAAELESDAAQANERILTHLKGAENKLADIFGAHEWNQLRLNELTLGNLPEATRKDLEVELGKQRWEEVATQAVSGLDEGLEEMLSPIMGRATQNRVYRDLLLRTITEGWVEYLTRMEALRVSITMESYAQRDPLVQYKRQASTMFSDLLSEVRQGVISMMFRYRPTKPAAEEEKTAPSGKAGKSKKKRRRRH